jgi:hypothetical protein
MRKPISRLALAMIVAMSHTRGLAQSATPALKTLPIRTTVADAEAEGAKFPRGPRSEHPPAAFALTQPGTTERKCTNGPPTPTEFGIAATPTAIRSGDFIIGGLIGGGQAANVGLQSKIWWAPYHNPHDYGTTLLVRAARLGASSDTFRYVQPDHAWPASGGWLRPPPKSDAEKDSFFPSGIRFPQGGRWLLIATAGDDWGCFILPAQRRETSSSRP